ncbi:hypothetical protein IC582_025172 [Cucumis melo]
MLIIKGVIEMTPEEEQLKIASGKLFENLRSSTIVQLKNDGSKRGREVVNDEDDFKKSKKQKSKTKMKKAIRNLQDRVAVVEGQLTSIKSDIDELKGMMSTILKHIGLQRKVDIGLEEPIDVVDDEVEIEDSEKKLRTHFDSDVTEIEQFPTQRPHIRPARRKRASVYLSTPFTTLPKRSVTSTTTS